MTDLFGGLELNPSLIGALEKENITIPTEVQQRVIPQAIMNKDLIVQSETGTGKTLAYLLPMFERLDAEKKEMQALVLVPTHELAIQVQRQVENLSQNSDVKLHSTPIIGNVNIERQILKLKEKPHIVIGSAGRILELIKKKKISAHTIRMIVLDEADRLLDGNNIDSVKAVIKSTLKDRQLMLFSATMPEDTIAKAKEIMKEPEIIKGKDKASIPSSIGHYYFTAERRDKIEVLRKLVRIINPPKAIVFVNKSSDIEVFTSKLQYHGLSAESIHGTSKKLDRKKIMDDFKAGDIQLLVASDIAARGLHIEEVAYIFNLDLPENPDDYLHRVGRSGRNDSIGTAVSIVTDSELPLIKKYEKTLGISIAAKDMYEGKIVDKKIKGRKFIK